jgi:dihydropyrimidinase
MLPDRWGPSGRFAATPYAAASSGPWLPGQRTEELDMSAWRPVVKLDTVIRGGVVVSETETRESDIGLVDGRVAALAAPGALADADGAEVIDAAGTFVVPGGIDTHTHIQWRYEDGGHSRDTFRTGSALAAIGGTTTVLDFVSVMPRESLRQQTDLRMAEADGESLIDYGLHPILSSADDRVLDEIPRVIEDGFAWFKIYTTFDYRVDDYGIFKLMERIADHHGLAGIHAENHDICSRVTADMAARGRVQIADFPESRPAVAEAEAIHMVSVFARRLGSPLWIYHVSGTEALAAVEESLDLGTRVRAETCAHYLAFDESVYSRPENWQFVIDPPIRDAANQSRLWKAIAGGLVSSVGSDHCAYDRMSKAAGIEADDFTKLEGGSPGIDARMPLLWSRGVGEGRLNPCQFVRVNSAEPARTMGVWPRKGALEIGSDADLVLIDPHAVWDFPEPDPAFGSDYSLYANLRLKGRPILTMVRGTVVVRDGVVVGSPGHGRFVRCSVDDRMWTPRALARGGDQPSSEDAGCRPS